MQARVIRNQDGGPNGPPAIEYWPGLTPYPLALQRQEEAVAALLAGGPERLFFCEHEPVLTLGSSAKADDAGHSPLPQIATNRGGQVTYHGPGQRVIYPIVKLERWNNDIRLYMRWLQQWLAAACAELGVATETRTGPELGLWVNDAKLAAFGVRVRKGVAFHGAALNVANDVAVYQTFTPCGLHGSKATTLQALNPHLSLARVDKALEQTLLSIWPKK